jgi:hypothetical protein
MTIEKKIERALGTSKSLHPRNFLLVPNTGVWLKTDIATLPLGI